MEDIYLEVENPLKNYQKSLDFVSTYNDYVLQLVKTGQVIALRNVSGYPDFVLVGEWDESGDVIDYEDLQEIMDGALQAMNYRWN